MVGYHLIIWRHTSVHVREISFGVYCKLVAEHYMFDCIDLARFRANCRCFVLVELDFIIKINTKIHLK